MSKNIKTVTIRKIQDSKLDKETTDKVIIEQEIKIKNKDKEFTLLCTPENIKELEAGFLFTQGLICNNSTNRDEINRVSTDVIFKVMDKLHNKQQLFKQTGGSHAAGIFSAQGEIVAFAEDVARHNAFDKAIGMCLLNNINMNNCGVVLSSRVSAEMMQKAVTARLHMVIAVSAPTSLAIELAAKNNIILCGFVRDKIANIYC